MRKILKKIALMLVMVMAFCQIGAVKQELRAEAASLPGLKYPSKVIYIDCDSLGQYSDNCWVPSQNTTGYKMKYQVTKGIDLITVSKNGKVTATGNGVGEAIVKVTYSKDKEKDITANFSVKVRRNAVDVKLTNQSVRLLDTAVNVGETIKFEAAKSYDGSYAKGHFGLDNFRGVVNDTLKLESLTPEIASVNGLTLTAKAAGTAKFVVKAYQYGDNKFTGVQSAVYSIVVKSPEPTPTPTPVVSAVQVSATTIALNTNTTFTAAPSTGSIKVNRLSSNSAMDIRSVTLDTTDKTKLIIETYASLIDNSKYAVVYNNASYEFTCSDGVIASMSISPNLVEEMTPTEIYVSCYDKNGVFIGKYDTMTAYNVMGLELIVTSDNGYMDGNKLLLYNMGNTAKAKAVYRTGKWDSYGNEIGTITADATIAATKAAEVTAGPYQYTIGTSMPSYTSLNVKNYIEVGHQGQNIYFYIKNSKGEDISYEYKLESSNNDLLIVGGTVPETKGISASIYALSNSASQAYVIVSKNNVPVYTLSVTIRAEAKLSKLDLDKYSLTLSNKLNTNEEVKVSLYDQYGQKMSAQIPTVTLLSAPDSGSKAYVEQNLYAYANVGEGKVTFNAIGIAVGAYTYRVQVGDYAKVVTVNVTAPNENINSSYRIILSANSIDAAVSSSDNENKAVTIKVAEYKGSVVNSYLPTASTSLSIKDSSGNAVYPNTDGNYTWVVTVTNINSVPVTKMAKGVYTVTVTINGAEYKQTFVISDSQSGVTAGRVNYTASTGTWANVLSEAFDFTYENENVDSLVSSLTYVDQYGRTSSASAASSVYAGTYNIRTVTLNIKISNTLSVPITVTLGQSITVR